ncbi:NAD(P)(+)--arginine ADP-ribosyltransferase 1-like [Pagrus major]|uniref:NAD(P)(+)--arginine ADP-ribosyltransferase 1-like n=1 Tax=Pagrus major TaxID=143350 RepID=UPI003CC8A4FB
MAVMALMAAGIITFGVSTGFAMDSAETGLDDVIHLDMALESVDDMYSGCKDNMKSKVLNEFLQNEKNRDSNFKKAWEMAEKKKFTDLEKEQAMAINVYTREIPNVYLDFNKAVRTKKSKYQTKFRYHTLHFFLTDALQTLNACIPDAKRCPTVYRRTNCYFSQDVLNKGIRFGSFTSSSMQKYPSSVKFGNKSCFEIVTCSGADITKYSVLKGAENEVLIPPYEVFKVTEIKRRSEQKDLPCEVVYKVKSTGVKSNTNCAFFPKAVTQI